jgi:hypothetical protein
MLRTAGTLAVPSGVRRKSWMAFGVLTPQTIQDPCGKQCRTDGHDAHASKSREAALNTVGYVLSRDGALTGRDLEVMTHGEPPWKLADAARRQRDRAAIRPEWMLEYFRTDGAPDDGVDDVPLDSDAVSRWLRDLAAADDGAPGTPDTADSLRTWATDRVM